MAINASVEIFVIKMLGVLNLVVILAWVARIGAILNC
jgi:hypothetical protein